MKEYCLNLASRENSTSAKLNVMREYLQAYILSIMQAKGVFKDTAFVGGTALRFLHGLSRFSEDMDFSSVNGKKYSFAGLIMGIKEELALTGYDVSATSKEEKTVAGAFLKFTGLLYEAGISPMKSQNFLINVEIDTNPPKGTVLMTEIVNKFFPISFLTYDIPSLFAGKIHALLSRGYTKGRDFFDLGWYLSKWKGLEPNFVFLQNALKQTGWAKEMPAHENWRNLLRPVVEASDWRKVRQDVANFLDNPKDIEVITKENILNLLFP